MFSVRSQMAKAYKHGRDHPSLGKERDHGAQSLGSPQALVLLARANYMPLVPVQVFLP